MRKLMNRRRRSKNGNGKSVISRRKLRDAVSINFYFYILLRSLLIYSDLTISADGPVTLIRYLNQNPSILKHLLSIDIETYQDLNQIKNIIVASKLLKHLRLEVFVPINPMTTIVDWTEFVVDFKSFQLEKLSIRLMHRPNEIAQILETQMHLKELNMLIFAMNAKMVEVILKMEKLKVLTFRNYEIEDRQLYDNILDGNMLSLERFNIDRPWTFFRKIINAARHLKSLSMNQLDQEFIDFAGLSLTKLQQLRVNFLGNIIDFSNPDLFPALEELQIGFCSNNQRELTLQEITNKPTTNFLRCLHEEIIQPRHNKYK